MVLQYPKQTDPPGALGAYPKTIGKIVGFSHNMEYLEGEYDRPDPSLSTEFGKEVDRYQDAALSQPEMVTRNGRDRTVMMSAEEYSRPARRNRHVFLTGDAPPDIIETVRNASMDASHNRLNDLLTDWRL